MLGFSLRFFRREVFEVFLHLGGELCGRLRRFDLIDILIEIDVDFDNGFRCGSSFLSNRFLVDVQSSAFTPW